MSLTSLRGFGLMQVLFAAAVVSLIAMAVPKITNSINVQRRALRIKTLQLQIQNRVQSALGDSMYFDPITKVLLKPTAAPCNDNHSSIFCKETLLMRPVPGALCTNTTVSATQNRICGIILKMSSNPNEVIIAYGGTETSIAPVSVVVAQVPNPQPACTMDRPLLTFSSAGVPSCQKLPQCAAGEVAVGYVSSTAEPICQPLSAVRVECPSGKFMKSISSWDAAANPVGLVCEDRKDPWQLAN